MAVWCQEWHLASDAERADMSVGKRRWGGKTVQAKDVPQGQVEGDGDEPMGSATPGAEEERVDEVVRALAEREEEVAAVEKELGRETVLPGAFEKPDVGDVNGDDVDAEGEEDDGEDAVGEVDMEETYPDVEETTEMGECSPSQRSTR